MKYPKAGDLQRETSTQLESNPPFVLPVPGQQIRSWDHGSGTLEKICEEGTDGSYTAHLVLADGRRVSVPLTRTEYDFRPRKLVERRTGYSRHEQLIGPPTPERLPRGTPPMEFGEDDDTIRNPEPNPWEVRSSSGLEGVFADEDDASFYADELSRSGASGVTARRRLRTTRSSQPRQQRRGELEGNPSGFSAKGERMYQQIKAAYDHKGDPRAEEIAARTVYASAHAGVEGLLKRENPRSSIREPWGAGTAIVIESNAHGYTGWLESASGGRIPISFGGRRPDTAHEALELAKKFLRGVYGKTNPDGDQMHGNPPRFREGTRVRFAPSPASLRLYGTAPSIGTLGTVTTVSLGRGRASYLPGPGGGLTYVNWDGFGVQGVSHNDLERVSKSKNPPREGDQELALHDRHSGGKVWLNVRDGIVVGVTGSDPKRYLGLSIERAKHVARHGGTGASKNPGGERFDTDILGGMEKAIWVTSWASWVEEMSKEERKAHGDVPVNLSGINWEKAAPGAPGSALEAAEDLYTLIERANGKTPGELFQRACEVDGCKWKDSNAELFGHYLAMQAMGHGVSWFDDHKEFPLKFPRHFEASTHDGEEVDWSPKVRSTQNGGPR